ncbi:MAG: hypothetical protein K0S61_2182 [Anaerocolumna sp.]|jgi:transcriptional regulator with XRE-family HTH domain|nr:hypothetical protein [Anaerocolumna sp.]
MEDKKLFGEYVFKRRKEIGLTQKEFATRLFVTESAVSKWERGLSYPDITLVRNICEVLNISEHELLTGSEDVKARNSEKLAGRYIRIIQTYRNILSCIYGLSLVICFICNVAIQQKLSWFFIVLTAIMVATSVTLLPVYIKYKRGLITLGALVGSIGLLLLTCNIYTGGNWFFVAFSAVIFGMSILFLPFILWDINLPKYFRNKKTLTYFIVESVLLIFFLYICNLYTGGDWFVRIALPIVLFSLLLPWGIMIIVRYVKVNGYFKAAGCFALGSIFQYFANGVIGFILKDGSQEFGFQFDLFNWNEYTVNGNVNIIVFLSLLMFTLLFACMGAWDISRNRKSNNS